MKGVPKNQHYIPKFILRNFCYAKDTVYVRNKNEDEILSKTVDKLFFERNLYTYLDPLDNNDDRSYNTEFYFAEYEKEIYVLYKDKIYNKDEITLTLKECNSLCLFLAILPYRNEILSNKSKQENKNNIWKKI